LYKVVVVVAVVAAAALIMVEEEEVVGVALPIKMSVAIGIVQVGMCKLVCVYVRA
jgi:hypothetical protein